jgi:hypothetical protein
MIRSSADGAFHGAMWEEAWSPQVENSAYSCRRTEISSRRVWGKPDAACLESVFRYNNKLLSVPLMVEMSGTDIAQIMPRSVE